MEGKKLQKKVVDKVGRIFAMLFNRAVMYNMNHPFTKQSLGEFHKLISHELHKYSPIVIIMHQDTFYVEDEPLDTRLNTSKMLMHFKKAGIQSVSFEKGLLLENLESFFQIFVDLVRYPNADLMLEAIQHQGVVHARLNHVFFKKVTVDDEVVNREEIKTIAEQRKSEKQKTLKNELLDIISGGIALDELGSSLSVSQLLNKPDKVSEYLMSQDTAEINEKGIARPGTEMSHQIFRIKEEVDKAAVDLKGVKLHDLAESVVKMKEELLKGLLAKKKEGFFYENEDEIVVATNELTDNVLLELVKDEYKQGATTINRLSQILRRLIPDNGELQRILPKLKEVLLSEGMSLNDFLELTEELEKELTNESLTRALKESAAGIGVSGEELIKELTSNPDQAAELIYLAAELRKETGDEETLSDLMVSYIERIGGNIALDSASKNGDEGREHLKTLITQVETEIVDRLKSKEIEPSVMDIVADKLNARMDQILEKLESSMSKRQSEFGTWDHETTTLIRFLEDNIDDSKELKSILKQVQDKFKSIETGEIKFDLFDSDTSGHGVGADKAKSSLEKGITLPKGVHGRKSLLYFIDQEILRSTRYHTPFSVATLSLLKALPQKKFAAGTVTRDAINSSVLSYLVDLIRDTDLVGVLDQKKIIVLLTMTPEEDAKLALRRLLRNIHSKLVRIQTVPLEVRFAGAITAFDTDKTPTLKNFIKKTDHDIFNMVQRIKNLQTLY